MDEQETGDACACGCCGEDGGADADPALFDPATYGLPACSPPPPAFVAEAAPGRGKRWLQGLAAGLVSLAILLVALYLLEHFRATSAAAYAPRFAEQP